jgi:DUF1365 family protein
MSAASAASYSVPCISTILGASPPSDPFSISVHGWNRDMHLKHCDFTVPKTFDQRHLPAYNLPDTVIIAVQKSENTLVQEQLLKDGYNVFFSAKHQRFFILKWQNRGWVRNTLASLSELVGNKARFFLPHI